MSNDEPNTVEKAAAAAAAAATSRIVAWLKVLRYCHCDVNAQYALLDAATRIADGEHRQEHGSSTDGEACSRRR